MISGRSNFVGLGSSTFGGFGSSTLGSSSFGGFGRSTFGGFDRSNLGGFGKLDFGVDSFGGGGGSFGGVGSFSSTVGVAFPVTFDHFRQYIMSLQTQILNLPDLQPFSGLPLLRLQPFRWNVLFLQPFA